MPVGLQHVRHVAQAQAAGLGHPYLGQPVEAIKPRAPQLQIVIEQQRGRLLRRVCQVGFSPASGFYRVYVAAPGGTQPLLLLIISQYAKATITRIDIDIQQGLSRNAPLRATTGF